MTERKLRVAVVFGGHGTEHADSVASAGSVLSQLDPDRFEVVPVGVTADGAWALPPSTASSAGTELAIPDAGGLVPAPPERVGVVLGGIDVVFPVLHGTYGADGTVQGLLELAGVPYAGAGVLASAAAMDGEFSRKLLAAEGLPVAPFVVLRRGAVNVDDAARERLGLPVFVAPARGGGGVLVTEWAALHDAIASVQGPDQKVVVSAAPAGRDVRCGVLEHPDGRVDPSLPAEIAEDGTDIPAKLPDAVIDRVRELAVRAFRALNCQGLAQVDFRFGPDDVLTVRSVETMPGFDAESLYPRMWAVTGIDGPTLVATLVETAIARGTGLR